MQIFELSIRIWKPMLCRCDKYNTILMEKRFCLQVTGEDHQLRI